MNGPKASAQASADRELVNRTRRMLLTDAEFYASARFVAAMVMAERGLDHVSEKDILIAAVGIALGAGIGSQQ